MEKILRVKLYGESFKLHKLKLDLKLLPLFKNCADKIGEPLHLALLNINFFSVLDIKEFQTLNNITDYTFSGLINNNRNQVEISWGKRKISNIKTDELFRPRTLFPLYNIQFNLVDVNELKPGIYIEEREIGLIGSYEIEVENLKIDLLKFYLTKINFSNVDYELLNMIAYREQILPCVKSDALLRYQSSFQFE
ncbi:hypothetical protein [Yeosuana sp.]|uniref:hypothetical protein n=1 Tax=Yeosuana sp. TaxID=2529388 RepID=UPI0040552628